jgi:hypothetical protein
VGTRQIVYTFTGSEAAWPAAFTAAILPAFSGIFTIDATRTGPTTNTMQVDLQFVDPSNTVCFLFTIAFTAGTSHTGAATRQVGTPSASWPCTDWTGATVRYNQLQFTASPLGSVLTITLSGAGIPDPASCVYGTRASASAGAIAIITDTAITAAATAFGAPWLAYLFAPLIGYALDTGVLCQTGPTPIGPISNGSWLRDVGYKLEQLQSMLWYSLCECVPAPTGQPPATPYTPPTLVQPPGWPVPPMYTCSNSDICTTLTYILKRLDELSTSQSIRIDQTTNVLPPGTGLRFKDGAVHSGLVGTGNITVSGCVGFRIELTAGSPDATRPGNPTYLWDVGWASIEDGASMLVETRITRASYDWLPSTAQLATSFGYFANAGLELRMTELIPV